MDCEPEIIFEDEKSEGEISTDSEDIEKTYIPLERPSHIHKGNLIASKLEPQTNHQSDLSDDNSPDSSSDSDHPSATKRMKLKIPRIPKPAQRTNKYSVWSSTAQEDFLTETMVTCDVTQTDRSRNVETYNYPKRRIDLKRRVDDRGNVHLRLGKRLDDEEEEKKGEGRHISNLTVTVNSADDEVAVEIAKNLKEEKADLLRRLVELAGKEKAINLYKETQKIEQEGGMLIMNQTRRRTPGGVLFFLVKHDQDITEEEKRQIFCEDKQVINIARRRKRRKNRPQNKDKKVPITNLITQAEIELSKGARTRKESEHSEHVSNPPPSPVTDGKENSSDEATDTPEIVSKVAPIVNTGRNLAAYDDDFLEINCENEMDFFS